MTSKKHLRNFKIELENFLRSLVNYFKDTLIGRPTRRQRRRNSIFSIQMWNCYETTKYIYNQKQINQSKFDCLLVLCNLTICKFIKALRYQQILVDMQQLDQINRGICLTNITYNCSLQLLDLYFFALFHSLLVKRWGDFISVHYWNTENDFISKKSILHAITSKQFDFGVPNAI
ncbi:Uncharacterized protein FWK35_00003108 [Aphis craccivora]|uniref:Uncharacterized protein n=1 Tax=Aphis craccivora TaxID=307492 RepID=A0A6G0ZR85_APHCR|nr:Uncharacterized protein FWK35_00003108 [Aphis craccivora]